MQEEEKNKLLDVNVLRGAGEGISDMEERYEIKVS